MNCAAHGKDIHRPIPSCPRTRQMMLLIDKDLELRPMRLSYDEEYCRKRRYKSLPRKGLGNNVMNKALSQVSKSPFTRNIEDASLPRRFHQPTFTLYTGRSDLVEHVSHFNQKMVVHSKDEVLMCKIFPSNLSPVAMRWFNG